MVTQILVTLTRISSTLIYCKTQKLKRRRHLSEPLALSPFSSSSHGVREQRAELLGGGAPEAGGRRRGRAADRVGADDLRKVRREG